MAALSSRQRQILNLAVAHFIKSAEPVASRTLVKTYKLPVGPATIRNEMADLEEMGFLEQPHTSAGRVPTDRGYREYVDSLREVSLSEAELDQLRALEEHLLRKEAEFKEILQSAAKILAEVTRLVAIAALPLVGQTRVEKIQLLEVSHRRVLVVLVTSLGIVETYVIPVDTHIPQEKLDQISRIFNESFSRASIDEFVRGYVEVLRELQEELRTAAQELLERFFAASSLAGAGRSVLVEGTTAALSQPDFSNFERAREMLNTFEVKSGIAQVLSQHPSLQPLPEVRIGHEIRNKGLRDFSIVIGTYTSGGTDHGSIGIVGPRRMDYPKIIAVVDYISKVLMRALDTQD